MDNHHHLFSSRLNAIQELNNCFICSNDECFKISMNNTTNDNHFIKPLKRQKARYRIHREKIDASCIICGNVENTFLFY